MFTMRDGEKPPIDHAAIREIGATMAQNIGALAAHETDRHITITFLNRCAERVPYSQLFAEYDRVEGALQPIDDQIAAIESEHQTEVQRLEGLVATFQAKQHPQLDSAKNLAHKKIEVSRQASEAKRKPLELPRAILQSERDELSETIESVAMAWPTPPFSEEVLASAYESQITEEIEAIDEKEDVPFGDNGEQADQTVEVVYGPYAELAAAIPSLIDRLELPASKHIHVYGDIETAQETLNNAIVLPRERRSELDNNLLKAVYVLQSRYLKNPQDLRFLEVYEARDIIALAQQLRSFHRKHRPDFNDLEGQILAAAATRIPLRGGRYIPSDLEGAIGRMTEDASGRSGMTWINLITQANRACDTLRYRITAGGVKNEYLKDYAIEVVDRSATEPDISWIYQFIADSFAHSVIAKRTDSSQAASKERFMRNCAVINSWLVECQEQLEQLPGHFRLKRGQNIGKRRNYRYSKRTPLYENVTAQTSIMSSIRDIMVRRDGNGDPGTPRLKPLNFDPTGALRHQLLLGHKIENLKTELSTFDTPGEGRIEEIESFA